MIHMGRGGEDWGLVGVNRPAEKRSNLILQKRPDQAAGNNSHKTIDEFLHIFVRFPLIPFSNKITAQKPKSNFTFSISFDYFIRQASNYFQIRQFSMEFNFLYIFFPLTFEVFHSCFFLFLPFRLLFSSCRSLAR